MLQLIKLEIKKARLGWYTRGALIANFIITIFVVLFMGFFEQMEGEIPFTSIDEAFVILGALVRSTFIIFAGVLIAKLIIEEYKYKTVTVLFTYPINRKKLMVSKLVIVAVLTFVTTFLSNIFVAFVFFGFNAQFHFVEGVLTGNLVIKQLLSMFTFAIGIAGTGLIPLYFGMRKHSIPATIISSIIVVALISSHNPMISIASIVYVPLGLAVIGLSIAYWSIKNIEQIDA